MNVQAYFAFNGNCQEALNFYSDIFNGQIINKQTYKNSKEDVPLSYREKLQHAELKGKGIHVMAYDASPDTPINHGNQIHMSVNLNYKEEAEHIFETLSKSGRIHNDFKECEWGYYGRCTDEFGINWMVNSDK